MNILLAVPMESPRRVKIENSLESMRAVVGGFIQAVYPFDELVALVCSNAGKLLVLPLTVGGASSFSAVLLQGLFVALDHPQSVIQSIKHVLHLYVFIRYNLAGVF